MKFIQRHLKECATQHTQCGWQLVSTNSSNNPEPEMPTRVIDVGGPEETVSLIEQPSKESGLPILHGKYTTLSHCWGPPERHSIRTTTENIARHRAAIPLSDLSRTFRDAVRITREIGIRYLWIDSLCIIQDDKEDWDREAPTMGLVYGQSYLTIAATGAADGTQGCFMGRDDTSVANAVPIPATKDQPGSPQVFLRKSPFLRRNILDDWQRDAPRQVHVGHKLGPLQDRAWVTQEWALSPRMIHCCRGPLVWACQETEEAEDGTELEMRFKLAPTWESEWEPLIQEYCSRGLTMTGDRLIAMQGIFDKIRERFGKEFVHGILTDPGLRGEDIAISILWARFGRQTSLERPQKLVDMEIPSWSWASTLGKITYGYCLERGFGLMPGFHCGFQNGFSELCIRSFLIKESYHSLAATLKETSRRGPSLVKPPKGIIPDAGDFESLEEETKGEPLYLVPVFDWGGRFHGLLLQEDLSARRRFKRIGTVWSWDSGYLNSPYTEICVG